MKNLDNLIYWVSERDNILQRKSLGLEAPWSEDCTFQQVYFCNVRREDDKVTKWIRENYNQLVPESSTTEFNMMLARLVNKPSSLKEMSWPFPFWDDFYHDVFTSTMAKPKSWGGAYIVSTNGLSVPKHEYICDVLTAALPHFEQVRQATTLQTAHKALMGIQGLGSFMAAQVVADLKNTKGHALYNAEDWWDWCAFGPGSLRGMAWVNETEKCTPTEFQHCMPWLRERVDELLSPDIPKFCNQDLQNCLCEFDKYMRVSTGVGRSKRKYNGRG